MRVYLCLSFVHFLTSEEGEFVRLYSVSSEMEGFKKNFW